MKYVDGFVLVVPKKNLAKYKKMAEEGKKLWMKYGALDYKECVGDDLYPSMGDEKMKVLTFPEMTKIKPSETVVFSYIVYKSRKHRDQVNAKVMKDPSMNDPKNEQSSSSSKNQKMPFDMKKMAYGGFEVIVGT